MVRIAAKFAALLLASTSLIVHAAEQDQPSGTPKAEAASVAGSDDIVVTAKRREETIQDVPVAVSVFGGATLRTYAVSDFSQISQLVPQLVVGRQVAGSSASIFLRGVGSTSLSAGFDQSVSLSLDGLPMSRGRVSADMTLACG